MTEDTDRPGTDGDRPFDDRPLADRPAESRPADARPTDDRPRAADDGGSTAADARRRVEGRGTTRRGTLRAMAALGVTAVGAGVAAADPPALNAELDALRDATAAYRGDLDAARADGWFVEGPFVPRMGYHFINPAYIAADHADLDRTAPAVLVYDDPDGDQDLLAAEYLVHGDHTGHPPDLFSDESADVRTSEDHGWEYIPPEDATGLHAWVWFDNPKGVFHHTNPRAPQNP